VRPTEGGPASSVDPAEFSSDAAIRDLCVAHQLGDCHAAGIGVDGSENGLLECRHEGVAVRCQLSGRETLSRVLGADNRGTRSDALLPSVSATHAAATYIQLSVGSGPADHAKARRTASSAPMTIATTSSASRIRFISDLDGECVWCLQGRPPSASAPGTFARTAASAVQRRLAMQPRDPARSRPGGRSNRAPVCRGEGRGSGLPSFLLKLRRR
jgi:hypothetical protein